MFGYRLIYIKKRTNYRIQPLHVRRTHELIVTKCHTNKTKQYCSAIKGRREQSIVNESKVIDVHVKEPTRTDFANLTKAGKFVKTDFITVSNNTKSETKTNITTDISKEKNTTLYKALYALYPNPTHTVNNIYDIVKKELNDNSGFNVHYKQCNSNSCIWTCIYSVSWPKKEEFIGYGESKVLSSRQAALKCLYWLHTQKKIRNAKPIIYSNEEVRNKMHKRFLLPLNIEILEKVEQLVNTYNVHIKDIMKHSQLNDNILKFTSSEKDFIYNGCTSHAQCNIRNEELQNRWTLLNNMDKKDDLPIFKYREQILQTLENDQTILIKGSTGCGKTTQVPQFILDSFIKNGNGTDCNILVSQPRRISAISIAERIALERNEIIGDTVGYHVRLEQKLPQFPGGILFCTTGILRQLIQVNPNLTGYSHVILDEIHERSLDIDILLLLLKRAIQNNSSLKLILMSATINADIFQKYYNCTSINIHSKTYPVKMHFMEDFEDKLPIRERKDNVDYNDDKPIINCQDIANLVKWIIEKKPLGTILCFLPGWAEIMKVNELLTSEKAIVNKMLILPLHSKLSNINQSRIFNPTPPNISKVILATDIAETGITVPDVIYIVDSAIKNDLSWDERKFSLYMKYQKVSQASIQQRKGRAGRTQPGESYHFLRKAEYDNLDPYRVPEILRSSLEKTIVDIKTYTNDTIEEFCGNMLQPPSKVALHKAIDILKNLNIIDMQENLTPLGKHVARIPIHPTLSKALVLSTIFQCFQPILHIATIYSTGQDIFTDTLYNKNFKREIKQCYHKTSDHLAIAMLYEEWEKRFYESDYEEEIFCHKMNISPSKTKLISKMCKIFINYLKQSNLLKEDYSSNSEGFLDRYASTDEIIHGIILSSTNKLLQFSEFSYNKGIFRRKSQHVTENNELAVLSSESVIYNRQSLPTPYFTYIDSICLHGNSTTVVRDTSMVSPLTTLFFSQGHVYYEHNDTDNRGNIVVNIGKGRKILFSCNPAEANMLISFRNIIWSVVDYFIRRAHFDMHSISEVTCVNKYRSELLHVLSEILCRDVKNEINVDTLKKKIKK